MKSSNKNLLVPQREYSRNSLAMGITAATLVCCVVVLWRQVNVMPLLLLLELLVGLAFMGVLSYTDLKSGVIPNQILLVMLGIWALFQVLALALLELYPAIDAMGASLSGGAFSFFVFGMVYLLTRRQLGGGDVKLAAVMGLYLTSQRVLGGILYGLVICAVYSLSMLLLKKLKRKDTVPLAPFLAIGYGISLMFVF